MAMLRTSRRTAFSVEVAVASSSGQVVQKQSFGAQVYSARAPGASRGARRGLQPSLGSTDDAAVHPAVAALPFAQKGLVLGALLARMPPRPSRRAFRARPAGRGKPRWNRWAPGPAPRALRRWRRSSRWCGRLCRRGSSASIPAGCANGWCSSRRRSSGRSRDRRRGRQGWAAGRGPPGRPGDLDRARRSVVEPGLAISAAGTAELRRRVFAGLVPLAEPGAPGRARRRRR